MVRYPRFHSAHSLTPQSPSYLLPPQMLKLSSEQPPKISISVPSSLCDKSFNQKNNLTTHLRTHSDYHPSSCSMCKQTFSSFNELFNHMRQHTEEKKPHICTIPGCNKVFNSQNDLTEHTKQHTNPKPYKCDVSSVIC